MGTLFKSCYLEALENEEIKDSLVNLFKQMSSHEIFFGVHTKNTQILNDQSFEQRLTVSKNKRRSLTSVHPPGGGE